MGTFKSVEAGGTTARVYTAGTHERGVPGVVVLHPWWGLNEDVIAFADRLAGEGFAIAAPDLFDGSVATTVEDAERLARSADEAAVESLRARDDRLARGSPGAGCEDRPARVLVRCVVVGRERGRSRSGRRVGRLLRRRQWPRARRLLGARPRPLRRDGPVRVGRGDRRDGERPPVGRP